MQPTVKYSKHNLSTSGTGSIKSVDTDSGGTAEICVFCHTPHHGNTQAPLWNKSVTVYSYTTYTSDVLLGLGYPAAEDPKSETVHMRKTMICLSCHDGTIALGSLVNLPYGVTSDIPMLNDVLEMPQPAAGYIGVNLRDDHPVAIQYDEYSDDELQTIPGAAKVRLYNAGSLRPTKTNGDYVECTSCHDPHDNQYGDFLVESNAGSALCTQCHVKTGFTDSIHDTANLTYSPSNLGTTVGGVKCMNCHFPHKAAGSGLPPNLSPTIDTNSKAGYYLLSFSEENSCFNQNNDRWNTPNSNTVCHGSNNVSDPTINIKSTEDSNNYGHHYTQDGTRIGKHEATEGQTKGWLGTGNPNWHVECADCHNPHTAKDTNHSAPTSAVTSSSPLYGAGGVEVTTYPSWTSGGGNYTYIEPIGVVGTSSTGVDKEYKICFKCHSNFAWDTGTAPNSAAGYAMTDQAMEFGGYSTSYHPVVNSNPSNQGQMKTGGDWSTGSDLMYCSDCHTKEGGAQPWGPHGSTNGSTNGSYYILKLPFDDEYSVTPSATQSTGDLCFDCHDVGVYLNGSETQTGTGFFTTGGSPNKNLHTRHAIVSTTTGSFAYRCVNCHAKIPHGYTRKAMIVAQSDTYESTYAAGGAAKIGSNPPLATAGSYSIYKTTPDCSTVAGCHQ